MRTKPSKPAIAARALALACLSLLLAPGTALAGNGNHGGGNSGGSSTGTPLASTDASWTPPACLYEPRFTPDQYEMYYRNEMKSRLTGKQYVQADWDKLEKERYNKGEDGLWWQHVFNENAPPAFALANCPVGPPEVWVPKSDLAPHPGVLTPKELKDIAYAATRLPNPPVQLSPVVGSQVVNLPTFVKSTQDMTGDDLVSGDLDGTLNDLGDAGEGLEASGKGVVNAVEGLFDW